MADPARAAAIHLGLSLPTGSSALPGAGREPGRLIAPYLGLLAVGFALPRRSPAARCALTAPFHPCLWLRGKVGKRGSAGTAPTSRNWCIPAGRLVRSSPAPSSAADLCVCPRSHLPTQLIGGVFSVALSLGSLPVAVSHHRALSSSDFPPLMRGVSLRETGHGAARGRSPMPRVRGDRLAHSATDILPAPTDGVTSGPAKGATGGDRAGLAVQTRPPPGPGAEPEQRVRGRSADNRREPVVLRRPVVRPPLPDHQRANTGAPIPAASHRAYAALDRGPTVAPNRNTRSSQNVHPFPSTCSRPTLYRCMSRCNRAVLRGSRLCCTHSTPALRRCSSCRGRAMGRTRRHHRARTRACVRSACPTRQNRYRRRDRSPARRTRAGEQQPRHRSRRLQSGRRR